ncbi:murein biosynthesis integral membrane protein MurJ [Nocardia vaccinii]|nr:murein biosynthesis integral membrane protein MurJ [Nocardia vaccinii]
MRRAPLGEPDQLPSDEPVRPRPGTPDQRPPSGTMRRVPPAASDRNPPEETARRARRGGPDQRPPSGTMRRVPPGGDGRLPEDEAPRRTRKTGPDQRPATGAARQVPPDRRTGDPGPPSGAGRRARGGPIRRTAQDPARPDQQPPTGARRRVPPQGRPPGPASGPIRQTPAGEPEGNGPRPGPGTQPGTRGRRTAAGPQSAPGQQPRRRAAVDSRPGPQRVPARDERSGPAATAQQTEVKPASANSRLLSASGSIAIATLMSRITGFGKQAMVLMALGPAVASAYTVSSQIPTMIEQLVLGAVLTAFVVPTLVRAQKEDPDQGAAFIRRLFTTAAVLLGSAALVCTALAPVLTRYLFLTHDGKVSTGLTTALAYLLIPAVLFYGMSSLLMAVLNTHEIFKPGAWAPVLNNITTLLVLGLYVLLPGEISLDPVRMGQPKLLLLGCGITFGVFVQVASMVPAIRRTGIDLRPLWGMDARLKQFGGMAAAVVLYVLISQAGFVFATRVSSHWDVAGPAIVNQAWLLLQLPYGVLGVTVLTAIMPRLSRNAADDDTPAVVDDLGAATRLTMIALVPVVLFLTVAGPQVGEVLYGYGHFGHDNAHRLGEAVSWSAFTLIPYALVLIHLRVFYAREQAWTPTWIILGITAVKILVCVIAPFVVSPEHVVMALSMATGLGFLAGAVIGGWLLHQSLGDLRMSNVGRTVTRVVLASVAGAAVTLIIDQLLGLPRLHHGIGALIRVGIDGIVMFGVAFGLMRLVGIPEIVAITVAISRKLGFTPPAPDLGFESPAGDEHETTLLPRPELAQPYYYRYDPYTDAQTMVLPVIRPEAVDRTGGGEFPYPVRQRNANAGPGDRGDANAASLAPSGLGRVDDGPGASLAYGTSTHQGEGGTRVSDDAAGGVPAAQADATAVSAVRTEDVVPGEVPPDVPGERTESAEAQNFSETAADSADDGHARDEPPHDPTYDTGMLPVGSPEMPPMRIESPTKRSQRGPKLIPGASVAGGRYRLLADCGGARGLRFWQALDVKLDREVALTFVDADQKAADNSGHDGPQAILSRTLRLGRINSPGLARVLDVVRGSSGGIVVAEWTPGRSLREMAETRPSPIGAARAVRALAAAAELAHRGGGSLSIDHPDRVRISASGDAVLAFPGTLGDSDAQSDVRGLGAMLYALITARWPIRAGGVTGTAATVGGLRPADSGPDGSPVEPRQIRPETPFEISAVAVRSLESNKGVRTAATVQHVLEQASVVDQKTDFIPVLRLGQRAQALPDESLADPELLAAEKERSQRMMWILVGLGVLAALVVGVIIWWLLSVFAPPTSNAPLDDQRKLGLTTAAVAPAPANAATSAPASSAPAGAGVPVPLTAATVFSPEGTPDDPSHVSAVLDGNPTTMWRTDQYFQQFPSLKKGVGILTTLGSPSKLTKVNINSPSAGTVVEIRTSPTASPTLDQTQLIGQVTLGNGVTNIPVHSDQPISYVLIWITSLAHSGNQYQSQIADIRYEAAR